MMTTHLSPRYFQQTKDQRPFPGNDDVTPPASPSRADTSRNWRTPVMAKVTSSEVASVASPKTPPASPPRGTPPAWRSARARTASSNSSSSSRSPLKAVPSKGAEKRAADSHKIMLQKRVTQAPHEHVLEGHERVFVMHRIGKGSGMDRRDVDLSPESLDMAHRLSGKYASIVSGLFRKYHIQVAPDAILSHMTCAAYPMSRLRVVVHAMEQKQDISGEQRRAALHGEAKFGSYGNAERAFVLMQHRRVAIEQGRVKGRGRDHPQEEFGLLMWGAGIMQRSAPSVSKAFEYSDKLEKDPVLVDFCNRVEQRRNLGCDKQGVRMYSYLVKVIRRFMGPVAGAAARAVLVKHDPSVLAYPHSSAELSFCDKPEFRCEERYGPDVFDPEAVLRLFGKEMRARYAILPDGESIVCTLASVTCDFLLVGHQGIFPKALQLFQSAIDEVEEMSHDHPGEGLFLKDPVFAQAAGILLDFTPTYHDYITVLELILRYDIPLRV